MVKPPWLAVALAAISVLPGSVQAKDFCPDRCSDAGPDTSKWSVYPNFNLIKRCKETVFYSFNLYDSVDDRDSNHRISACTSFGADFDNMEAEPATARLSSTAETEPVDVKFELGWWEETFGLAAAGIISLSGAGRIHRQGPRRHHEQTRHPPRTRWPGQHWYLHWSGPAATGPRSVRPANL